MANEFSDQQYWAIILGGSSGLGLAAARKLASHGMHLCIVHRDPGVEMEKVNAAFDEIRATGVQVLTFNADVTRADKRAQILETLQASIASRASVQNEDTLQASITSRTSAQDQDTSQASITSRPSAQDQDSTQASIASHTSAQDQDITQASITSRTSAQDQDITQASITSRPSAQDQDITQASITSRPSAQDQDSTQASIASHTSAQDQDITQASITPRTSAQSQDNTQAGPPGNGKIRCLLHSIARGTLKAMLPETGTALSIDDYRITLDSMAYSLYEWVKDISALQLFASDARVLSFTSEGSHRAWKHYGAVSAAKAALEAISRNIALEFAPMGIRANCIQAGTTNTRSLQLIPGSDQLIAWSEARNPFQRLTSPEDVANVVYLLCKDEAAWINGAVIPVDGGAHIC
jgi:NAD(P)-dependent dehydrogenase (short-subunit alcohol dehydrogenase family)